MSTTESGADEEDCELGKLSHWEETYEQEISNLAATGDEGEIWFGEDVMQTMINWVDLLVQQHKLDKNLVNILDVGTGNGVLLVQLAKLGYRRLTGSDYSPQSIALSGMVLNRNHIQDIQLQVDDVLDSTLTDRFDVITDKGTLDAVGLMEDPLTNRARYRISVWSLLKPGGLLVITSCNSTQHELCQEFAEQREGELDSMQPQQVKTGNVQAGSRGLFEYVDHVQTYPKFKFGGVEGTKVCTVALRRRD